MFALTGAVSRYGWGRGVGVIPAGKGNSQDDGGLGVTSTLEGSDDGRAGGHVDGGDGKLMLPGILEEGEHIVANDNTGLAGQNVLDTHFVDAWSGFAPRKKAFFFRGGFSFEMVPRKKMLVFWAVMRCRAEQDGLGHSSGKKCRGERVINS
jgi:hypothetical protein